MSNQTNQNIQFAPNTVFIKGVECYVVRGLNNENILHYAPKVNEKDAVVQAIDINGKPIKNIKFSKEKGLIHAENNTPKRSGGFYINPKIVTIKGVKCYVLPHKCGKGFMYARVDELNKGITIAIDSEGNQIKNAKIILEKEAKRIITERKARKSKSVIDKIMSWRKFA